MKKTVLLPFALLLLAGAANAQTLTLRLKEAQKDVSPMLYGLMTEEINYAYEGGLYAQLVRDPQVKELVQPQRGQSGPVRPRYWELADPDAATMTLRQNEAHVNYQNNSLLVEAKRPGAALLNRGFWGMAVRPATSYEGSLYAKGSGSLTLALVSSDGGTVYASQRVSGLGADWRKFSVRLATGAAVAPTKDAMLRITFDAPGTYQLTRVMLFPPSYKGHGLRSDLMELMAGMKPAFLRFPL